MEKILRVNLYNDGIGYVELIDTTTANLDKQSRVRFVTSLAAISRGKDKSKTPLKTFNRLKKEAEGATASRPMEFLPVALSGKKLGNIIGDVSSAHVLNKVLRYSYLDDNEIVYTNARALLNAGVAYKNIPFNTKEELKWFRAFRVKVPFFVHGHLNTHTAISKEAQSDRISVQGDYWLPSDLAKRVLEQKGLPKKLTRDIESSASVSSGFRKWMLNTASQNEVQAFLKSVGYGREIYSRAPYYFKYKEFVMTGWENDDATFRHLVREREGLPEVHKSWVQKETAEVAVALAKILNYKGE